MTGTHESSSGRETRSISLRRNMAMARSLATSPAPVIISRWPATQARARPPRPCSTSYHLPHNLALPPSSSRSASRAVSRSCSRFRSIQGRCSRMNRLIRPDGTPSGAETTTFPPGGMIRRRIFFIRFQVTDTARSSTWIRQSSTIYETHFRYQNS